MADPGAGLDTINDVRNLFKNELIRPVIQLATIMERASYFEEIDGFGKINHVQEILEEAFPEMLKSRGAEDSLKILEALKSYISSDCYEGLMILAGMFNGTYRVRGDLDSPVEQE
jgi:hypothetical protein